MNFEQPFNSAPQEAEENNKEKSGSRAGKWLKKQVALAGAVGLGFLGSVEKDAHADSAEALKSGAPKAERYVSVESGKPIESSDSFDVLARDAKATWGVEYVTKAGSDGQEFIAERYVKIDNKTGAVSVLGEFDDMMQVAAGISKLSGIPEAVRKHAGLAASAIKTERDFQASGFTEPTGNAVGKTTLEKRAFAGYGVNAKNTVEVDEQGKVVRVLDSENLNK